ncbi:MAG: hypothetical protein CMP30_07900 [Roseibacillus sp.]|nr:hypothetical protein [Roseibacillus sp.]
MDATPEFYSINDESRSQDSGFIVSAKEAASENPLRNGRTPWVWQVIRTLCSSRRVNERRF